MSQLFTSGRFRGFLDSGAPNVGGRVYTYASGTTTQQNAFTDATLSTPCTYTPDGEDGQYIALDTRGEAQIWIGTDVYTFVHKTASGTLIDTTDGVTAAAGGGVGTGPNFIDGEVPAGAINSSNTAFTLGHSPSPAGSLSLYLNGQKLRVTTDYSLSGSTITYVLPPQTGDTHETYYRY